MTSLKTSIKTITYLSDIGCLEIQGASLFNKNMNVYTAYQINLLDKSDYVLAHGLNTDDQLAFGIVYQF